MACPFCMCSETYTCDDKFQNEKSLSPNHYVSLLFSELQTPFLIKAVMHQEKYMTDKVTDKAHIT